MDDKTLLRLSVVIAVAGLVSLIAAAQLAEPMKIPISKIDENLIGRGIEVNGTVESISVKDGNIFIRITDGSNGIDVVMFKQDANDDAYAIKEGDSIVVMGKVNFYRNSLEIVANSLRHI